MIATTRRLDIGTVQLPVRSWSHPKTTGPLAAIKYAVACDIVERDAARR